MAGLIEYNKSAFKLEFEWTGLENSDREPQGSVLSWKEYMVLIEHSPMMVWRSDTTAACDYFNERWLEFTGRKMAEELGDGWAESIHPDDFDRCLKVYLDSFYQREPFEMEYRLRRHDGEYRWILDRAVPVFDAGGYFTGFVGSCVDINDAVIARMKLEREQEKEIKTLRGLLPICSGCKRVRDDEGYWVQIESYLMKHADMDFTHGLCDECVDDLYPEEVGDSTDS